MDSLLVTFVSRWLHVASAIVLLGGSLFILLVLMPAARNIADAERTSLHEGVMGRWRKIVGAAILLLLLTGFYNYLAVNVPLQRESPTHGMYHALMGTKILLSLGVFFLASALTGRAKAFEKMRQNRRTWMLVTVLLGTTVVGIGSYLRVAANPAPQRDAPATASATAGHGI